MLQGLLIHCEHALHDAPPGHIPAPEPQAAPGEEPLPGTIALATAVYEHLVRSHQAVQGSTEESMPGLPAEALGRLHGGDRKGLLAGFGNGIITAEGWMSHVRALVTGHGRDFVCTFLRYLERNSGMYCMCPHVCTWSATQAEPPPHKHEAEAES